MNERIQQLADEAKRYALETYPSPYEPYANLYDKKFAELIVKECMEQVWYTREDKIDETISQNIKARMKHHFGVEK